MYCGHVGNRRKLVFFRGKYSGLDRMSSKLLDYVNTENVSYGVVRLILQKIGTIYLKNINTNTIIYQILRDILIIRGKIMMIMINFMI